MIDRDQVVKRFRAGETYAGIAADSGCTRQYIQQIITKALGVEARTEWIDMNRKQRKAEKVIGLATLRAAAIKAAIEAGTVPSCAVCLKPAYRRALRVAKRWRNVTCSKECSQLWIKHRTEISEEAKDRHRIAQAKTCIAAGTDSTRMKWAYRALAGEAKTRRNGPISEAVKSALARVAELRGEVVNG